MNRTYAAVEKLLELRTTVIARNTAPLRCIENTQALGLLGLPSDALLSLPEWSRTSQASEKDGVSLNGFCHLIPLAPPDDPLVRAFQGWLHDEVLPSKARTGIYMLGQLSITDHPEMSDKMLEESQHFCVLREAAQLLKKKAFSFEHSADIWHAAAESLLDKRV